MLFRAKLERGRKAGEFLEIEEWEPDDAQNLMSENEGSLTFLPNHSARKMIVDGMGEVGCASTFRAFAKSKSIPILQNERWAEWLCNDREGIDMTDKAQEYLNSRVFIELYSYKPAWVIKKCQRTAIIDKVIENVGGLAGVGINVLAYGRNDESTDRRAPYDFFCVYQVSDANTQHAFEREIAKSGWYDIFDQVNVSGVAIPYPDLLSSHIADVSR